MSAEITPEMIARVRRSGLRCIAGVYVPAILDALESSRAEVQRLTEEARRSDAGRVEVPREECPECGSKLLEWGISHTTNSSAPDGRLRMHEIQTVAHLGCQECSETVRTLDERGILNALRSSTNHDAQDAGEERASFEPTATASPPNSMRLAQSWRGCALPIVSLTPQPRTRRHGPTNSRSVAQNSRGCGGITCGGWDQPR